MIGLIIGFESSDGTIREFERRPVVFVFPKQGNTFGEVIADPRKTLRPGTALSDTLLPLFDRLAKKTPSPTPP